ncbi:Vesicle transport protein SFT2B [Histomonas meleagridis]|uniref:Vesicle transport protein SFT2B n=1 Tax=Histomonas meleagridis TaxID=135588 RepID=UPI003559B5A1|nr:Vesicle transport protein SFT2B [Histomonas meleagridis]KAH0805991.1 Vesicle transport protein SFT2B [Histomonas meleagridis]
MSTLGMALTGDNDDEGCCDLSFKTRVIAGVICSAVGILFSFLSFISFSSGDLAIFAVVYTLGIVASVGGSFFIAGPKKHFQKLKEMAHLVSSIVLVGAIVMVFISAFAVKSTALAVIFVIVEVFALFFFMLTLNTVGWTAFKAFVSKIFKC